jgi:hypothetical protein
MAFMTFSDDSESEADNESDEDYVEPKPSGKGVDPQARPTSKPKLSRTASGSDLTTFTTGHGLNASVKRKYDQIKTSVTGMKKQHRRAPTDPSPGHVTLHHTKKSAKGRRQYNPNDQQSTHVAGLACMGVPGTKGTGTVLDASPHYNRQHLNGHESQVLAHGPGTTWNAKSEIDLEKPNAPGRVQAIASAPGLNPLVTKDRIGRRMSAVVQKSPKARSIKRFKTEWGSLPGGGKKAKKVTKTYGRDLQHMCKDKWFKKHGYDPDDSSGDEDVTKGKAVS